MGLFTFLKRSKKDSPTPKDPDDNDDPVVRSLEKLERFIEDNEAEQEELRKRRKAGTLIL